jgi:hypothetical protein
MKKNIGSVDRIARISIGVIAIGAGIFQSSGFLILIGAFSIFEALVGWCALYQIIGVNTCPVKQRAPFPFTALLKILGVGFAILIIAILLNAGAYTVGWDTWYDFLKNIASGSLSKIQSYSIDNFIFLFIVYPLCLGFTAQRVLLANDKLAKQEKA